MLTDLSVIYKDCSLTHTIDINLELIDNIPYNLAEVFEELIKVTNSNSDIVIKELIEKFGYEEIE